jgi:hypothetical protein
METIFIYFLKSSGLIITFFAAYYFLLRKETFFTSNRWFLLSGLILSVILPLFFIKKVVLVDVPKVVAPVINSQIKSIAANQIIKATEETDWFQIGFYVYATIALFFLMKIFFNLISLYKILYDKTIVKDSNFHFVDTEENSTPFSFFNYIVFNSKMYSKIELNSILLHEKIHSAQKHSADVLLTNLFAGIFWFNPFMHLYKKAVIQNLEYIADSKAVAQIQDAKSYQMTLLKVVSNQNCLPITNHFYQSLIKKRIVMLNKNQSHQKNSWKYAAVLPALIAFVLLFQVKVIAQEKVVPGSEASKVIPKKKNTVQVNNIEISKNEVVEQSINDSKKEISEVSDAKKSKRTVTALQTKEDKNMLLIINGKEFFHSEIGNNTTFSSDGSITQLDAEEGIKRYGAKGRDGVLIFNGTTKITKESSTKQESRPSTISNSNGDDILFMNNNITVKVPGHPAVTATETQPILIINGIEQNNPKATMEILDISKIKELKVLDENNKETAGTTISKIIITTK